MSANIFMYKRGNLDIAYILGIYLTDGYIANATRSKHLVLTCLDESIHYRFQRANENLFGHYGSIRPLKKDYFESRICSTSLCDWLSSETQNKSWLPEFVYHECREWQLEFLSGLLDGDGWCTFSQNRYTSRYGKEPTWYCQIGIVGLKDNCYLNGVPKLLDKLGIQYKINYQMPRKEGHQWQQRVMINPKSALRNNVYFHCTRKQQKLLKYADYILRECSTTKREAPDLG